MIRGLPAWPALEAAALQHRQLYPSNTRPIKAAETPTRQAKWGHLVTDLSSLNLYTLDRKNILPLRRRSNKGRAAGSSQFNITQYPVWLRLLPSGR